MNKNSKIAVSGGAGFIGSNIIRLLNSKGYNNIDVYEKLDSISPDKLVNLFLLNIRSLENKDDLARNVSKYSYIVLCGADSSTKTKPTDYEATLKNNFHDTRQIIDNVITSNWDTKIVFASSCSVYGLSDNFTERTKDIVPQHLYGLTKLLVDRHIEDSIFRADNQGDKLISFRFSNICGNSEKHKFDKNMASPVSRFLMQEPPYVLFRDEESSIFARDFLHVEDLAKVVVHTLENEVESGIYNLGSGVSTTWEDLVRAICKAKGLEFTQDIIKYEPLPDELKGQYQKNTRAKIDKLRQFYKEPFMEIEEIVAKTWKEMQNKS